MSDAAAARMMTDMNVPNPLTWSPSVDVRVVPRNLQGDAIDARACGNIKYLVIRPSPSNIAHPFRNVECAEMLALRGEDPNAARSRAIQIPLLIYLLAVGRSSPGIGSRIKENLSVRKGSISLHGVAHPQLLRLGVVYVEILLIRREAYSIGTRQIFHQQL